MHTVFALLCFVVVMHWLIFPYPPGLLHWHCGNLTIAPVPAKQPWWIWINTSSEFIMNDCITTTKQSTTKPCAYFLGYTVRCICYIPVSMRLYTTNQRKIISGTWEEFKEGLAYLMSHVVLKIDRWMTFGIFQNISINADKVIDFNCFVIWV